jgi:predicted dehydrogenase
MGAQECGGTNRRRFLRESASSVGALALGTSYASTSTFGANERIRLGIVGPGSRGGSLMAWAHKLEAAHNVRFTAVCDIWNRRRTQAAKRVEAWNGRPPAVCRTIDELCDRKDVDAVIIATADFQHCFHAAVAVQAGKDVYVEKPFGCDFEQVKRAYDTIVRSDRVLQVGTQSRGAGKYYEAAKFVQSGRLGQVTYVEIAEPIFQQRWRIADSETSLTAADTDWNEFLCYLPKSLPFNPRHYREFRLFWPFSSGPFCQWMSHRIDLVNLVLGKLPIAAVSLGGVFLWKDGRTNPDTVQSLLEYPGGTLVSYQLRMGNRQNARGITIYGTQGTLELDSGLAYGDGGGGLVVESDRQHGATVFRVDSSRLLRAKQGGGEPLPRGEDIDYLGHFFDCVRSRKKPRGDIDAAFGHSVATILANQAYRSGCKMAYDPVRREMQPAGVWSVAATRR